MKYDLNKSATKKRKKEFVKELKEISDKVGMKISSRGWCYQLEGYGSINKNHFDKVEKIINDCRKQGFLPIDFIANEEGRSFSGVEIPDDETPSEFLESWINALVEAENYYVPDWWDGEEYYVQMLVEKIDLKTLFKPICKKYHIPIATSSGWSSMLQRAIYGKRFKEAEERGLKTILLYCGDHDPDGLRISDKIRKNLDDIKDIIWDYGETGYNPSKLKIVRFGLNYDFIEKHKLTWIDNLITGTKDKKLKGIGLDNHKHPNHNMPYVQAYLKKIGVRKCEANAIITIPKIARKLAEDTIQKYLGLDAEKRFLKKKMKEVVKIRNFKKKVGLDVSLSKALEIIEKGDRGVENGK